MKTKQEHHKSAKEVKEFYNDYIPRQTKVNINLRHLIIYDELIKFGLNTTSNVLEVGCGIGTLTSLLLKKVKKGKVYGTDISDKSIEICNEKFSQCSQAHFEATDMSLPLNTNLKFDFIVFADVLEHIPHDQWNSMFNKLSLHFKELTKLLINYPSPYLNKYYRENQPEKLQIIDQELHFSDFKEVINTHNLNVVEWKPHSIFMKQCDYILCKLTCGHQTQNQFTGKHWSKISFRKQLLRLKHFLK